MRFFPSYVLPQDQDNLEGCAEDRSVIDEDGWNKFNEQEKNDPRRCYRSKFDSKNLHAKI